MSFDFGKFFRATTPILVHGLTEVSRPIGQHEESLKLLVVVGGAANMFLKKSLNLAAVEHFERCWPVVDHRLAELSPWLLANPRVAGVPNPFLPRWTVW